MAVTRTNPEGNSQPTGYTHVVTTDPGRTVYIAGQVSLNEKGEVVGEGDFAAQAEQVYANLRTCLAAAGATFADVVKQQVLVVNWSPELRPALTAARTKAFGDGPFPASTLIGVQALALPAFLIEVEVIASLQG